ncbi:MAG TPA: hypothetical protein VGL53_01370 [Bryobacteraceae bacterium]|jgi:hypothetical protein
MQFATYKRASLKGSSAAALLVAVTLFAGPPAQNISVTGWKVSLPAGRLSGATFYPEADRLLLQEEVFIGWGDDRTRLSFRRITAWSLKDHSDVARRDFHRDEAGCGHLEVVRSPDAIYICSPKGDGLEILDPKSLNSVGRFTVRPEGRILSFAVDKQRNRVAMFSYLRDASVSIAVYSLDAGALIGRATVAKNAIYEGDIYIDYDADTGRAAVSQWHVAGRWTDAASITVCELSPELNCKDLGVSRAQLGQPALSGQQMLIVGYNADIFFTKRDCVEAINIETLTKNRKAYCSPTGVHYTVGVVAKDYVVGFTGRERRHPVQEYTSSIQTSFSVWRRENPKVAAVVRDPTDYGDRQYMLQIIASRTAPMFLTYSSDVDNNAVWVYLIEDPERAGRR